MSRDPYRPPDATPESPEIRSHFVTPSIGVIVGSAMLVFFGIAVASLGMLPSDAPSFFLACGGHLFASGGLGLA
jgi:hypothetical protein